VIPQISQNLKQRLIFSILATVLIFIVIYFSQRDWFKPIFTLAVASVISAALWELDRLIHAKQGHMQLWVCIFGTFAYAFSLLIGFHIPTWNFLPDLALFLTLVTSFILFFSQGTQPLMTIAFTFFAILYLTIPLGCLISINYFFDLSVQDGRWWLFYLIGVTKMTDVGAFIFGKNLGKTPFAPFISPKKTWEGAYGGILIGVVTSFAIYMATKLFYLNSPISLTLWESLWLGGLISIFAQLGDLAESLLKRDAGIKDSNQLPGLGGVLDILDSIIFTAPLLYIFLKSMYPTC
jgi:phosphatidate cytidylyltransferase